MAVASCLPQSAAKYVVEVPPHNLKVKPIHVVIECSLCLQPAFIVTRSEFSEKIDREEMRGGQQKIAPRHEVSFILPGMSTTNSQRGRVSFSLSVPFLRVALDAEPGIFSHHRADNLNSDEQAIVIPPAAEPPVKL